MSTEEPVVAREQALKEFADMCAERRLDIDEHEMTEDEKSSFNEFRDEWVKLMARGRLKVVDNDPVFTTGRGDALRFHKPTGATLMAMDGFSENQGMAKTVASLAEITQTSVGTFKKLDLAEFNFCAGLIGFLLRPEL
jgi:hypothetical protein